MGDINESQTEKTKLDPNDPLDRIAMEAMGEERAQAQADADFIDPPTPPGIDPAQTWGQIPFMLGKVLSMALPELAGVYNEQACYQWGVGMAAVSEKYGWDAGEVIGRFGPEIALAVASVPLVVPTYQAIKARREAKEREEKARPREEKDITPSTDHPMGQAPGGFVDPA
ncbi:hypothetical protein [Janthinobacterium sp.]|uniref:hypothetical protein n=1 Tax=Janthinobacterium sp. TaxID=1871054 RepID=UPI002582C937|nr:hypothetical protein [Janthinobacterium sp.]MCX7289726.1 hypothetical protein [Janthinobacterium sp.]